jgi:hypothetical protein
MRFAFVTELEVDGAKRRCAPRSMETAQLVSSRIAASEPDDALKGGTAKHATKGHDTIDASSAVIRS